MRYPKNFPRYDDVWHIDSTAVSDLEPASLIKERKGDPAATAYTEMYCDGTHAFEKPDPKHER